MAEPPCTHFPCPGPMHVLGNMHGSRAKKNAYPLACAPQYALKLHLPACSQLQCTYRPNQAPSTSRIATCPPNLCTFQQTQQLAMNAAQTCRRPPLQDNSMSQPCTNCTSSDVEISPGGGENENIYLSIYLSSYPSIFLSIYLSR